MSDRTSLAWWSEKEDPHLTLTAALDSIEASSRKDREMLLRHVRMYGNMDVMGLSAQSYFRKGSTSAMTLNVVRSVVDTAVNQVARSRPRPRFLTSGGNRSLRKRGKLLERYVDGQMYLGRLHDIAPEVFRDAAAVGTGVLKVYRKGKKICFDRVFRGDIWVDPVETRIAEPRTIYQTMTMSRDEAIAKWPEHETAILMADMETESSVGWGETFEDSQIDFVRVVESWHLGSGDVPGRRVVCLDNVTLEDKPWTDDDFPFIFIHWNKGMLGFWGHGVAEGLTGIQVELNRTLRRAQTALNRFGVPWVMVEQGSKVNKAHLNNQIGAIVTYAGTPPIVRPNQALSPEVFAHINWLYEKAYEMEGVSFGLAQGEKPAGASSGIAIQEAVEVQTGRFALKSRAYENLYMEVAKKVVALGKEIYKSDKSYSVILPRDKNSIDDVRWKDVDLDADAYMLKVFPSSSLPTYPTGRLQRIIEMMNAGLIDPQTGKQLLDFEDLEAELSLETAASDNIDRMIEVMLDDGTVQVPEPFMDLQLFLKRAQAAYNRAQDHEDVPRDHLNVLRQSMQAARGLQKAAMAEQQAMMAPPDAAAPLPAGPAGAPPAAPTSEDGSVVL